MKKKLLLTLTTVFLLTAFIRLQLPLTAQENPSTLRAKNNIDLDQQFDATRVLVKYKEEEIESSGLSIKRINDAPNNTAVGFVNLHETNSTVACSEPKIAETDNEKQAIQDKIDELLEDPAIEFAEPNYIKTASTWTVGGSDATPGDYETTNHWYYEQANLPELWHDQGCDLGADCGGDSAVTVAVIDTGVAFESYDDTGDNSFAKLAFGISGGKNYTAISSDLSGINLYTNGFETPNNGKDDDCNGFVDDYNGVDTFAAYLTLQGEGTDITCPGGIPRDFSGDEDKFVKKMGHPIDTDGHGTAVTGNIVGNLDNETNTNGTVSPNSNITLMPIAANIHYSGLFYTSDLIDAVTYAAENGADIINMSVGSSQSTNTEKQFFKSLFTQYPDLIITAASGNSGVEGVEYPAAYEGVIAVGAVDSDNTLSYYSNYGKNIDLVAYVGSSAVSGDSVYQKTLSCFGTCTGSSTFDTISENYLIGTSFAAPQVAAAAAILKSDDGAMTGDDIKLALMSKTTDILDTGSDNSSGNGVLDYEKLLTEPDVVFDEEYYFPAYANNESTIKSTIKIANPSTTTNAKVAVYFDNVFHHFDTLAPGNRLSVSKNISGVNVMVTSDEPLVVTQKAFDGIGFNEMRAVELSELGTDYLFPAYAHNGANLKAYIKIGNPSTINTANVTVKMNGSTVGNYAIAPGERVSHSSNIVGALVEVTSDENVFVTQKAFEGGGYSEMVGIKPSDLGTTYYFPSYAHNGSNFRAFIKVGNPSTTTTANVTIKMNGSTVGNYAISPGERISHSSNITGANVEITSDINVFVTQKAFDGDGFNEMIGIKDTDLNTDYYFPAYAHNGNKKFSYIKVGNPSTTNTANITVKMNGSTVGNYAIAPGARISHSSVLEGVTVDITSDENVIVTQKSFDNDGYNEIKGIVL